MSQTTNYSIPFIPEGAQDWKQSFDQILESLDATLAKNRRPTSSTLSWGDISGGMYLESTALGIRSHGSMDMLGNPTKNFVVESFSTLPSTGYYGQIAVQTSNNTPYIYLNGVWKPFAIPASGLGQLGIINNTDHYNARGGVVWREVDGSGVSVVKAHYGNEDGELLAWNGMEPYYVATRNIVGRALARGSVWSSATGEADANASAINLPADALNRVGGVHILVGDSSQAAGLSWMSLRAGLLTALSNRGELLVGTDTGGTTLNAPKNNEILVGDTSSSTGWQLRSIDDIVPANVASNSTALIFANANLG